MQPEILEKFPIRSCTFLCIECLKNRASADRSTAPRALRDKFLKSLFHGLQCTNPFFDIVDYCHRALTDRSTLCLRCCPQGEQLLNFFQGETKILSMFNEPHTPYRVFRIEPVVGYAAGWPGYQTSPLIV